MESIPEEQAPEAMPPPAAAAQPPPKGPRWGAILLVTVVVAAVVASLFSFLVMTLISPAPRGDDTGDGGGVLEAAYIQGQAAVSDCGIAPPYISFRIQYANLGNTSATNVVAHYVVYQFEDPTITRSGTISIGTVDRHASGSVGETLSTLECGLWGQDVEVSFTWD